MLYQRKCTIIMKIENIDIHPHVATRVFFFGQKASHRLSGPSFRPICKISEFPPKITNLLRNTVEIFDTRMAINSEKKSTSESL